MQSLINDLLSFSKQSVTPSDFKEVDLNVLVEEIIAELEIEIEKNNAKVSGRNVTCYLCGARLNTPGIL